MAFVYLLPKRFTNVREMPLASQMLEFLKDPISVKVVLSNFGDIKMLLNLKLVSICDFGKMNINMTDKIEKRRAANCVYHIGASIKDLGKKCFGFSKMATK